LPTPSKTDEFFRVEFMTDARREAGSGSGSRLKWADVARGACVILVVAMHAYGILYEEYFSEVPYTDMWDAVVSAAQPVRMPLFFLISGFLASRALRRTWRTVTRSRIWSVVYLYYVWLAVYTLAGLVRSTATGDQFSPALYIAQLVWPNSSLWYLYALVLYFIVSKISTRFPIWMLLPAAAVLSVIGTSAFPDGTVQYMLRCFVFFLVGVRSPDLVSCTVKRGNWWLLASSALVYGAMCVVTLLTGVSTVGLILATGVVGIIAALWISRLIEHSYIAGALRYIGRNTLAIFVMHPVVIAFIGAWFATAPSAVKWISSIPALAIGLPGILTATVMAACLGLEWIMLRGRLRFMFELPRFNRGRRPIPQPTASAHNVQERH
jgi:threonine dehydratase